MTLRRQFLLALVGLVVLLSLVFAGIASWSMQSLLGHAVHYITQSYTQQWDRVLTYYYEENGSWDGLQKYVKKTLGDPNQKFHWMNRDTANLLVFDENNNVIASSRIKDEGKSLSNFDAALRERIPKEWHVLEINGRTVGHFWLDEVLIAREEVLARTLATSIMRAMLIGLVVTSLAALVLGVILTRRMTGPLRRLTQAVSEVGQGNLTPRLEVKGSDDIALLTGAFNQMTEKLARNEEVRRNMVADIAHELRTPLSVILGKLESIQEGVIPSNPEVLLPIQDETLRLIRLVRDLQQLTLAEAGKLPLSLKPLDLRGLLDRIVEQFGVVFQEREIDCLLTGEVPDILADADRMTQVFVNLIGNALLHTPVGGKIMLRLECIQDQGENSAKQQRRDNLRGEKHRAEDSGQSAEPRGKWIKVEVEDTGEGMDAADLEHIFDRFYRADKSRERETGGTGLGLAIAKEFVYAHGGRIEVRSTPGQGSCFTVWLVEA
ncbi:MAG: ATP-binding protein [Desulfitobacteriaceae bacterium]|nr:ATP-binding protein [Desulfitobacteriaceae bacterium]MDI6879568.1 ATP-binding protein [Desulfitobacteriaceae bacterium]MDI6913247.1 ATP-binding protein [Desulfitobacteriaceae bacterium]